MKIHELKTDPHVYGAIIHGTKFFEIRKNDRDFMAGDVLVLRETFHSAIEMAAGSPTAYTGRFVVAVVPYVMRGPIYGLQEGWAIMSIDVILRCA